MAATGANRQERHLAQPPRGFEKAVPAYRGGPGYRGLHFPNWVAAVLVCLALFLALLPATRGQAQSLSAASSDVVVPILFPLENRVNWVDTFGAPRSGGRTHAGNDLMAAKMTPILAVVDGTVDWLNLTGQLSSYNNLPYYNLLLHGDDGNDYFYIHLNNDTPDTDDGQGGPEHAYAPGLTNGSRVSRGQLIGYVGDSGNAEDCESHLHFEIHLGGYRAASAGETRPPSAINPYPSLKAAPTLAEWEKAGRPPLGAAVTTTTTSLPSAVPGFTDVLTTDWFYADFALAREAGVVIPDPDHRFRPYSQVSRALFTVYLVRTLVPDQLRGLTSLGGPNVVGTFADVPPKYWAFREIEMAYGLGLVKGTKDGSVFSPDDLITRAQMATMIQRALFVDASWTESAAYKNENKNETSIFKDVPADYWAADAITGAQKLGLLRGDTKGYFRPLDNTTRAQAITVMARILRLLEGGLEEQ